VDEGGWKPFISLEVWKPSVPATKSGGEISGGGGM